MEVTSVKVVEPTYTVEDARKKAKSAKMIFVYTDLGRYVKVTKNEIKGFLNSINPKSTLRLVSQDSGKYLFISKS